MKYFEKFEILGSSLREIFDDVVSKSFSLSVRIFSVRVCKISMYPSWAISEKLWENMFLEISYFSSFSGAFIRIVGISPGAKRGNSLLLLVLSTFFFLLAVKVFLWEENMLIKLL